VRENRQHGSEGGEVVSLPYPYQPVESIFNWIEEKTGIEIASKVRSYQGLLVHVFGRLAAAMFLRNVLPQSA
jgi:hypothetical protein